MNYYNPYFSYPYAATSGTGLFSRLTSNFSFSGLLNGVQKTLNIANQAIPVVKQIGPVMKNAKTMFRVMNEFKKIDTPNTPTTNTVENTKKTSENVSNKTTGPTFFI